MTATDQHTIHAMKAVLTDQTLTRGAKLAALALIVDGKPEALANFLKGIALAERTRVARVMARMRAADQTGNGRPPRKAYTFRTPSLDLISPPTRKKPVITITIEE